MKTSTRAKALACTFLGTTALALSAQAQAAYPLYRNWDENGYDLVQGDMRFTFEEASIGSGKARLALIRNDTSTSPMQWDSRNLHEDKVGSNPPTYHARKADGSYFSFTGSTSDAADGATLTATTDPVTFNYAIQITDGDGTKYLYVDPIGTDAGATEFCSGSKGPPCDLLLSTIISPDGTVISVSNDIWTTSSTSHEYKVSKVSNNYGYSLNFAYQSTTPLMRSKQAGILPPASWYTHSATNLQQSGVTQESVSYAYPVSGTVDITDPAGKIWELTASSIKKPGDSSPSFTTSTAGGVTTVVKDGVTTTYNRSVSGSTVTLTKTDQLGKATTITSDLNLSQISSIKDPLNRTISYGHDSSGRLTSITNPEGDGTDYVLDARGNATQIKQRPKTGSSSPSLITNAVYPTSCTNPVTCNEPTSVTDPKGNTTDYTYDSIHGGVLTVTRPAPSTGGVRPQTRYTYTLSTVGSSTNPPQVYLLTGVSECQTSSSCAGGSDEVKTTIGYDLYANPTSFSKGNGNGALTATDAMTYDAVGNLLTVDGPLAGSADTIRYRYDAARRLVGVTSPDPDGAGTGQPNRATRYSYDGAGRMTKEELGTVNSQSDTDWAAFTPLETIDLGLDSNGRVKTQKLSSGSTAYALTQLSYDGDGRLQCQAVRMNTAAYSSLPADACTLGTQGSFGPDRITKSVYDDAGEVTQMQEAVGTSDAANERTLAYSGDGDVQTVKDAENNLTTYVRDEYDRLKQTQFPSATKGSGTSNAADYEQLGYDLNGNVVSKRLRDGTSIGFTYDNLNRLTFKDLPGSEPDVTYGYDNLGRLTSASQTGNSLTFGYDALSRKISEAGPNGTTSFAYDLADEKTGITYSTNGGGSALTINYTYFTTGDLSAIQQSGTNLASYGYDGLGNRTSVAFANGASQAFTFDPVSRLASLTNDLAGTASDLTVNAIVRNPASEITSLTKTNDSYAYAKSNVSETGTANGLNQLTAYAGKSLGHTDARGNVTAFGSDTFGYSSENLLTSGTVGGVSTTLSYDPAMRLYQTVSGSATSRFAYDDLDAIAEYDGSGNLQRRWVFDDADGPVVQFEGTGVASTNRRFLSEDERGSIISVTDSGGNSLGLNKYDEFGQPSSMTGRYGYTGQAWVPSLGLWYYKARFYSPAMGGTFLQTDPIGYDGDGPNLYAYVLDNPVNYTDPLGLQGGCTDDQNNKDKQKKNKNGDGGSGSNGSGSINVCGQRIPSGGSSYIPSRLATVDQGPPIVVTGHRPKNKQKSSGIHRSDFVRSTCAAGVTGGGFYAFSMGAIEGVWAPATIGELAEGGLALAAVGAAPVSLGVAVIAIGIGAAVYYHDRNSHHANADAISKNTVISC